MKLATTSPTRVPARRFGIELRRALDARGTSVRAFAEESGFGRTRITNWLGGDALPALENAERLADLLVWPALAEIVAAARRRPCDSCGREFTVPFAARTRYCSVGCKHHEAKRVTAIRDLSRSVLARRVRRLDEAIAAMCAECEPGGLCRTPGCPLQQAGVAPIRLARTAI